MEKKRKEEYYKIASSILTIYFGKKDVIFDYGNFTISTRYHPCSRKNMEKFIESFNPEKKAIDSFTITFNFQKHTGDAFSFICHDIENNLYYHEALSNCGGFHTKVQFELNDQKRKELYYVFAKYYTKLIDISVQK